MINSRFGKLTVISREGTTKARHANWNCLCDCGTEVTRTTTALKRQTVSSCGCYSLRGKNNPNWDGVGEISKAWWANHVTRARKKRRHIDITVTHQEAWDLFIKQDRKCSLSGLPLKFPTHYKGKGNASLDRIDSDKCYSIDNVQWVDKKVNIMKNKFNQSEFIELCKLIAGGACEIN